MLDEKKGGVGGRRKKSNDNKPFGLSGFPLCDVVFVCVYGML